MNLRRGYDCQAAVIIINFSTKEGRALENVIFRQKEVRNNESFS